MKNIKKLTFVSVVILSSLILSLVFPISVLADDATPPAEETSEVLPPTQEPVTTEAPVMTEAPIATEAPVIVEATPTAPGLAEAPATDTAPATQEASNVSVAEIVQAAVENDVTLADAGGHSLSLSSVEAAETLSTGDPFIVRSGITHRFLADCTGQPINATNTCTTSATPIQTAINFALAGETIFVESGVYNEQLTINTANLTLYGDPGNLTLAGVGSNAPVLDGSPVTQGSPFSQKVSP